MKPTATEPISDRGAWAHAALSLIAISIALFTSRAAAAAPSDCTSYVDRTGASDSRSVVWDFGITTDPGRCMKVRVGQTVTWMGDAVGAHPLLPDGGSLPNPIPSTKTSTSGSTTFTQAGTFGYICGIHSFMTGAILVVAPPVPASTPIARLGLAALLLAAGSLALSARRRRRGGH